MFIYLKKSVKILLFSILCSTLVDAEIILKEPATGNVIAKVAGEEILRSDIPGVDDYLKVLKRAEYDIASAKDAFRKWRDIVDKIKEKATDDEHVSIEIYLKQPPRINVTPGKGPWEGNENAKIEMIVFNGYQCPFSARLDKTFNQLQEKYGKEIKITYRQFPLDFHRYGKKSAKAALCAYEQGQAYFIDYKAKLFENQRFTDRTFAQYAKALSLNMDQFNVCLESEKVENHIANDIQYAKELNVQGTPAVFLNGILFNGAYPIEVFEEAIKMELAD